MHPDSIVNYNTNVRVQYKLNPGIIDPQTSGVYATCNRRKEKGCAAELKMLLQDTAEALYGDALTGDGDDDEDEDENLSIEESLKKELASLQRKDTTKKEPISQIELGCECVVFFKTRRPIDPEQLVERVCKDAFESKLKNTRFTQKLTPITFSSSATMEEVEKLAKRVLAPHFHKEEDQEPHTFAIKVSARSFNTLDKTEILQKIASCVGREHGHKVDLKKYEKLILVECFKNNVGMSVVDNYDKYQKFNLQQIFEKEGQESGGSRVRESGASSTVTENETSKVEASVTEAEIKTETETKITDIED